MLAGQRASCRCRIGVISPSYHSGVNYPKTSGTADQVTISQQRPTHCQTNVSELHLEVMEPQASHSAAGQALGYVHQVQWALVALAQRARRSPATHLRLETLDDIELIDDGQAAELVQVKHQVRQATDLTENSVDLWRSLNVWIDAITGLSQEDMPVLRLVTTANIPPGSILNSLRGDSQLRDMDAALQGLEEAATSGQNQTSQAWRQKFLAMDRADRLAFLELIVIDDGSPQAGDVTNSLAEAIRFAPPKDHVETFINYLLGWWYKISVRLLDRTLPAISAADLDAEISDLRDTFLPDNLPVAPEILQDAFNTHEIDSYQDRQFVQQLLWIALDEPRLWRAIRDYHRAWAQRSEWLRRNLISEAELDRFAFALHDEWDFIFHQLCAKMQRDGGSGPEETGQEILEYLSAQSQAPVRERFTQLWLSRGTLHALADGWSGRMIGWHPDFETRLQQLLSDVKS